MNRIRYHGAIYVKANKFNLAIPTVHRNGTSKEALMQDLENASNKLYEAIKALEETAPNGRDYYVQGPSALAKAEKEFKARADALKKVYEEIGLIMEGVADQ